MGALVAPVLSPCHVSPFASWNDFVSYFEPFYVIGSIDIRFQRVCTTKSREEWTTMVVMLKL